MLSLNYFFTSSTAPPPCPLHEKWYNITSYLDNHNCKQISIVLFLTDVSFLQNYIVLNKLYIFGGRMAASTLCILSVVSRPIL